MDKVTPEVRPGEMTARALQRAVRGGEVSDDALIAWFTGVLHLLRDATEKRYGNHPILNACIASLANRTNDSMFWLGDDWPPRDTVMRARQLQATGHSVDVFLNVFEVVSDARFSFSAFRESEFTYTRAHHAVNSLRDIGVDLRSVDALTALHLT